MVTILQMESGTRMQFVQFVSALQSLCDRTVRGISVIRGREKERERGEGEGDGRGERETGEGSNNPGRPEESNHVRCASKGIAAFYASEMKHLESLLLISCSQMALILPSIVLWEMAAPPQCCAAMRATTPFGP